MRILAFDPGMRRMGWASVGRENGLYYHTSGVLHSPEIKPFQKQRLRYIDELQDILPTIFDLTNPDYVVNETVPAVGSFAGTQMYLANVAITVVQTFAFQRGLEVKQIGATTVQSRIAVGRKGRKVTKVQVRNGVIQLFPELQGRKSEWSGKDGIYEEPDAIAIGAVELGHTN